MAGLQESSSARALGTEFGVWYHVAPWIGDIRDPARDLEGIM